ncbi:hypothetical protein [Deinococcus maricopensis]|uniref:Uncharacterized protein n=1 Tax=Deinococcus maricopensis (strain DSM 21211 / LMG 22137 / NRRL B-23946 / LB-34) TaxID=709986 RepID=E8U8C5_DEIML|nr:hypothetical protein [Deinococcus maricopensis]ADV67314.1 hypothetical protein Deima_1665 [Deinococcus maricopensis DSM 21211]
MTRRLLPAALLAVAASSATAQTAPPFLPRDYFQRYANEFPEPVYTGGLGLRRIPVPFPIDLRLTYVRHPLYTEFGAETRYRDTTFALGRFRNDARGATLGAFRVELTHDPSNGLQFGGFVRDSGQICTNDAGTSIDPADPINNVCRRYVSTDNYGKFSVGYAKVYGPFRLLGEGGYAFQGAASTPYARAEAFAGVAADKGQFAYNTYAVTRIFAGTNGKAQLSADAYLSGTIRPEPNFSVTLSHFERQVAGDAPIGFFNLGNYRRTNLDTTLTLDATAGPLTLRNVQYHAERVWYEKRFSRNELSAAFKVDLNAAYLNVVPRYDFSLHTAGVRTDVLLRTPTGAFGPTIDYARTPAANNTVTTAWRFGITFGPR